MQRVFIALAILQRQLAMAIMIYLEIDVARYTRTIRQEIMYIRFFLFNV